MIVLIVDGYNVIGAWDELSRLKEKDLAQARDRLIEMMAEYRAYSGQRTIVVFDAYFVKGIESKLKNKNVEVIYTKEKETADECIEKLVKKVKNVRTKVYVATSDYAEQRIIFGQGALRKSSRELYIELKAIEKEIAEDIRSHKKERPKSKIIFDEDIRKTFEKWRRGDM